MKKRLYERDCKPAVKKKVNESEEIDRKAFSSLIRYGDKPWDGYAILNDGYFVKRIHAEDDEDARNQFQDWLKRGGTSVVENNLDEDLNGETVGDFKVEISLLDDEDEPIKGTEIKIPVTRQDIIDRYSEKTYNLIMRLADIISQTQRTM